jgi:hypothetical protein
MLRRRKGLTYLQLSGETGLALSTLSAACSGRDMPSRRVVDAIVCACGDAGDVARIKVLWEDAGRATGRLRPEPGRTMVSPDPGVAVTAAEFVQAMRGLRAWAGDPSLAVLNKRARGHNLLPPSTLKGILDRTTLPRRKDVVSAFARACGLDDEHVLRWETAWEKLVQPEWADRNLAVIQVPGAPAALPASGQVYAMFAVDIAGFTRADRDSEIWLYLRRSLYQILQDAFQASGLPWAECHHEDRGDGVLVIVPPHVPSHGIIDPLPERLRGLIRRHNRVSRESAQMQLRAAVNIGLVNRDDHGLVGDDINLLFRMLDARPLRRALADSGAELALAVSRYVHDYLIVQHPSLIDPALFRPLESRVKRTRIHAWIYVPGQQPP